MGGIFFICTSYKMSPRCGFDNHLSAFYYQNIASMRLNLTTFPEWFNNISVNFYAA
jgi:hypothetical protein